MHTAVNMLKLKRRDDVGAVKWNSEVSSWQTQAMIGQDPTSSLSLSQVTTAMYDFMVANLTLGPFETKKIM